MKPLEIICRWLKHNWKFSYVLVKVDFFHLLNAKKNAFAFDFPILMSSLINKRCEALFFLNIGLIDSISVLKKAFPAQSSYKQEELAKVFLGTSVRILG